ncbi:hypothetical protein Taro_024091 [Colocasia esculenta]|uniref:Uncharacterized protein n=1 Tax=Colocasia esculenta TaxID=4460 RepID=A0A843V5H2_COLES|nr:hypothetical protein [Colocasia esculenta]
MSGLTPVRVRRRPPDRDCLICRLLGSDCDSLPVATKKATERRAPVLYTHYTWLVVNYPSDIPFFGLVNSCTRPP